MEMIKFVDQFYSGARISTFLESCGVADLITTCYGGRNKRVSAAYVTSGKVNISLLFILYNVFKNKLVLYTYTHYTYNAYICNCSSISQYFKYCRRFLKTILIKY